MMNKILFWLKNARYIALPQSLFPAFLASFMAAQHSNFSFTLTVLSVLGVIAVHLGANLTDDYFDYKKNKEAIMSQSYPTQSPIRKGKCGYLVHNKTNVQALLKTIIFLFSFSLLIASIAYIYRGVYILYYVLLAGFLSISYSGFPFRLSYHGLGELIVGLMFGPLLMSGIYYVGTGEFPSAVWMISVCVGLLVTNILYVHSIMDYEADKSIQKKTLAILIRNKNANMIVAFMITFLPYFILLFGVFFHVLNKAYGFLFILLPLSIYLYYILFHYIYATNKTFHPRWWMGYMGQWKAIEKAGIDQFMLRWLLARNICMFFCILASIICFV